MRIREREVREWIQRFKHRKMGNDMAVREKGKTQRLTPGVGGAVEGKNHRLNLESLSNIRMERS